ncbi:hypothetical protein M3Y94_00613300 [Aphelenchoides besseyi]|nr:hypothetical protein M3Y94_00613300 [Aphelenchoides besseyi]KAI6216327.1 hypothetical protein M3Y95_01283100 [Aphelenchoides besseyi]
MTHTQTLILQQLSDRLGLVLYLVVALTFILAILLSLESAMFIYTIQLSNSKPAKKKAKPQQPASVIVIGKKKSTVSITLTDSKSLRSKNPQSKDQSAIKKASTKKVPTKSVDKVDIPASKKASVAKHRDEVKKREAKPVDITTAVELDKSNATVNQKVESKQEVKPPAPPSSAHSSVTSISSFNSSILNDSGAQKNEEANKLDVQSPPAVLSTAIEKPPALGPNGETAPIASPPRTLSPPNSLMMNENKLIPMKGPSNAAGSKMQNDS